MDETERAELIAALHQSAAFGEGSLDLNQQLIDALASARSEGEPVAQELTPRCSAAVGACRSRAERL
jgi:hypothetical protein